MNSGFGFGQQPPRAQGTSYFSRIKGDDFNNFVVAVTGSKILPFMNQQQQQMQSDQWNGYAGPNNSSYQQKTEQLMQNNMGGGGHKGEFYY